MIIKKVEFIKSAAKLNQLPPEPVPHIAFAGRSNVGKSSMLNTLFQRKKLVKVSSTPGKTQLLNFFMVNDASYFVDLPGYGFAKVPIAIKDAWQKLIEDYLHHCDLLRGVFVLIDGRHDPQKSDIQLIEWLSYNEMPIVVVATKADKLSRNQLNKQMAQTKKILSAHGVRNVLPFSSVTGSGKEEVLETITILLNI